MPFCSLLVLLFIGLSASIASANVPPVVPDTGVTETPLVARPAIAKEGAEGIKLWINMESDRLGRWVDDAAETWGPDWMGAPGFLGISPARYLASLVFLGVVGIFTVTVVTVIRKRAGRIETGGIQGKSWPKILLTATRKPLALVLWVYGVHLALSILFDAMAPSVPLAFLGGKLTSFTYVGVTVAVLWLAFRIISAIQKMVSARAAGSNRVLNRILVAVIGMGLRALVVITGLLILAGTVELPAPFDAVSSKVVGLIVIALTASLVIRITTTAEKIILEANRLDVADNLRARQIFTQVSVIRRIVVVCTGVLAVACGCMLFQAVRQFGTSILASAGIAGIVLGLAAQKTLSNLFAGIQIAISQPIRIDDVVIVEGEWGWIEEIALTFVTVRIWDLRRLVLPINYFLEKPFQNWTRRSSRLINSFFLHVDYTLPVEPLREELGRLLKANPLWDGDVCCLQVTDSTATSMEIRCLMSSADAPQGWDLKCEVREGLVSFLRRNFPESLPRMRAEILDETSFSPPTAVPSPQPFSF